MAVAEKRTLEGNVYSSKHIVMDIEGTTTSISFVKDTLFPYVRKNVDEYVKSHWAEEEFKTVLALLKDQAAEDKKAELEGTVEIPTDGSEDDLKTAVVKNILWQMDGDRKTAGLKKLQGYIWRKGYKTGELKGHLFADVAPALKEWAKDGKKLYVYSSGSVDAQKLLFGYSSEGDLTELFSGFFDTEVGAKTEVDSYKSIVKKLDCNADEILFLTDLPKEASAARDAGLPVVLVEREGNEAITSDLRKEYSAVSSFGELSFETTSKKQKVDTDEKEPESAEEKAAPMDVDPVEETNAKVVVPEPQAEAMDVDKKVEEPAAEESAKPAAAETEASKEVAVKSQENGSAEEKSEAKIEVPKTEAVAESQENGTAEEKSKQESEVPKAESVEKETKIPAEEKKEVPDIAKVSESSEKVVKDEKIVNAEVPSTEGVKEKPSEEVTATEQVKESEKTEVLEKKTDDKNIEKMETESDKVLPKEDTKTEETETKPEAVVEAPAVEKTDVKVDKVEEKENTKDSKDVEKETVTEVKEEQKETTEVKDEAKTAEVKEDKAEVAETPVASATESEPKKTPETEDSKSENAEKEKSESGEMNGGKDKAETEEKEKLNGVANGNKEAATNGTVANGHSKEEKDGKDGIPEVIVSKNAPQIENGTADAGVAMEA